MLVIDQLLPRNLWCVGRVLSVKSDAENRVRSASVRVTKYKYGKDLKLGSHVLERPISKLILLKACDEL